MNAAMRDALAFAFRQPVPMGGPIRTWQLGDISEARYDVPDAPMEGEMDPFFFLTKDKNFIPHEYPCRTQFAAERRGHRPQVQGVSSPTHWWLSYGSPRVDLSGFWFRPAVIAAWAQTAIEVETVGEARLRLTTCGGAVLFVNGMEAGWLAPYLRNSERSAEFDVALRRGRNEIAVFFDDLAERDAKFMFELDYLSGPAAEEAVATPIAGEVVARLEHLLESMRFDRLSYREGPVALVFPEPMPVEAGLRVAVEGGPVIERLVTEGATSVELGASEDLPADFRHFEITLEAGGFVASRTLGTEITHVARQGAAPKVLMERALEALDEVSGRAEGDAVRALARLATGRGGAETDAMIEAVLPAIEDCHDCADFMLVPLLWAREKYGDSMGLGVRERVDRAILGYRYWMDEPGNDVQWYFSENHALLFHTAAYLAGNMIAAATFVRSRRTGAEQAKVGAGRVRAWLDHFERWEMAEFNSAPYFPIDFKGLAALAALAPDADIRERAECGISRLLEIVARSAHQGIMTAAQGRSYEHSLRPVRSVELSAISRLFWGRGYYGRKVHALPLLALLVRDHGYAPPPELQAIACRTDDAHIEWRFAQGQDRIAKLYHYKSRAFAMGSVARYRWNEWGYQETPLHLRLGDKPEAQIWINHPGEVIQFGSGRPSFWGGSGTLPRVHQYRGLAILDFAIHEGQPDFTHAWFPASEFDAQVIAGDVACAMSGDGLVLLKASGPLELATAGPSAGVDLRLAGRNGRWIVRVADTHEAGGLDAMRNRFGHLGATVREDDAIVIDDPAYGPVIFHPDGVIEAEGRRLDPSEWTIRGEATTIA